MPASLAKQINVNLINISSFDAISTSSTVWASQYDGDAAQFSLLSSTFEPQNVATLSVLLLITLTLNVIALPVIVFRRTKFGNGLFAVLILCLNVTDLSSVLFSLLGSLVVEASHLQWAGGSGSCKVYHWLSAWLTGLSTYLLVAIVGMVMVKTSRSPSLQRLRECRWLLIVLLIVSGIYALPELFVRSTLAVDPNTDICIIDVNESFYGLYVSVGIIIRYVIPAVVVVATMIRPETSISKRVSRMFFAHVKVPCCCGDRGNSLPIPHECPTMQTAMLQCIEKVEKPTEMNKIESNENGSYFEVKRPDLLAQSEKPKRPARSASSSEVVASLKLMRSVKTVHPEESHRMKYKAALATAFVAISLVNFVLDISCQIQSSQTNDDVWMDNGTDSVNHAANLVTALYATSHLQQVFDPIIFLVAEFLIA